LKRQKILKYARIKSYVIVRPGKEPAYTGQDKIEDFLIKVDRGYEKRIDDRE
jgi:hypothetical protein